MSSSRCQRRRRLRNGRGRRLGSTGADVNGRLWSPETRDSRSCRHARRLAVAHLVVEAVLAGIRRELRGDATRCGEGRRSPRPPRSAACRSGRRAGRCVPSSPAGPANPHPSPTDTRGGVIETTSEQHLRAGGRNGPSGAATSEMRAAARRSPRTGTEISRRAARTGNRVAVAAFRSFVPVGPSPTLLSLPGGRSADPTWPGSPVGRSAAAAAAGER